jgi:hypothetical protein
LRSYSRTYDHESYQVIIINLIKTSLTARVTIM